MTIFSEREKTRYQRQMIIPSIGEEGQKKLRQARVLVAGAGGLGSPLLYYLTAAGVGCIGIADPDRVDISNLQRQILYTTNDTGLSKAEVAAGKLSALNPEITLRAMPLALDNENISVILDDYDLIVDCTDNFRSRYLISDATKSAGKPMVYGAVFQFFGQVSVFNYKNGPSYRNLFPEEMEPEKMNTGNPPGIIGALPGIIGSFQACEVIKIVLGNGDVLSGKLLQIDALNMHLEVITL